MAFLDKLNDFAKNISDKTNDTIEISKQNSKISSENKLAAEELKKIGEFYYGKYLEGAEVAPEIIEFCNAAKAHFDVAAEAQAEIDRIHAENEAQKAAAEAAKAEAQAAAEAAKTEAQTVTEAVIVEAQTVTENAGVEVQATTEPAGPKTCPSCGNIISEGAKFCGSCGSRIE